MKNPLVSIVIPFYNGREFIKETLTSVINQSYDNWECFVIDDNSPEACKDLVDSLNDRRIFYIKNNGPNGMANARNYGIKIARGKYVALLDQDDLYMPKKLEKQVKFLENNKDIVLVGSWRQNFGENNYIIKHYSNPEFIKIRLLKNSQFTNPSIMVRKDILKENNIFYREPYAPVDDYDLFCRIVKIGKLSNIPEILFKYRIHKKQISQTKFKLMEEKSKKVRREYILYILNQWNNDLNFEELIDFLEGNFYNDIHYYTDFLLYLKNLNIKKPIFNQFYWEAFLFENFLNILKQNDLTILQRFKFLLNEMCLKYLMLNENRNAHIKNLFKSLLRKKSE